MRALRSALVLAAKDLRQVARDRSALLILVVMPLLFTLFFGLVFRGSGGAGAEDARLPVRLAVEDRGFLGARLAGLLAASRVIRTGTAGTGGEEEVARGELAAAVLIPAGYTQAVLAAAAAGGAGAGDGDPAARVEVAYDRSRPAGHTARNEVLTAVRGTLALVQRTLAVETGADTRRDGAAVPPAVLAAAVERELAAAGPAPDGADLVRMVPWREEVRGEVRAAGPAAKPYEQAAPGMLVQFVIFGLMYPAAGLVTERRGRTLARLATLPLGTAVVPLGKFLGILAVALLQELVLVAAGQLLFGLDYLARPAALGLVLFAFALFAASFGLLVGLLARKEEEVTLLAFVAMIVLSALGGAWFPLEGSGPLFRAVSLAVPTRWAMAGLQGVLLRAEGMQAAALPAAVLTGFAALLLGGSTLLLRRRVA